MLAITLAAALLSANLPGHALSAAQRDQSGIPASSVTVQQLERRGLIMLPGDDALALAWTGDAFLLLKDARPVPATITFTDDLGRLSLAAMPDDHGHSTLTVHAEINPAGHLTLTTDDASRGVSRLDLTAGAFATCNCFGTSDRKRACTAKHCDEGEDCNNGGNGSAACRWSAGQLDMHQSHGMDHTNGN